MDNASPWQAMARATQAEARDIVAELNIEGHWRRAGAVVHAVGSFRTGLLVRHRDIDFHVYTPTLDRDLSFRVMAALASSPYLNSLHFVDGSATEERCLEWHGIWQRPGGAPWQIDIIHIESGSTFDGYFERFADRLCRPSLPTPGRCDAGYHPAPQIRDAGKRGHPRGGILSGCSGRRCAHSGRVAPLACRASPGRREPLDALRFGSPRHTV